MSQGIAVFCGPAGVALWWLGLGREVEFGMPTQASAKTLVVDLVQGMPEDSSYDEILEELLMNRMVERGLADVEAGRVISHEEMEKTIESWRS